MPKPYLSHSAFSLYRRDPMEFYQEYFIARVDRTTDKMTLGKIFQEAWCHGDKYDYARELRKAGFTSNYARIFKLALGHKDTLRLPKNKTERMYRVKGMGLTWPILGVFDGFDPAIKSVVENKFGVVWSAARAKEDTQLTWYSLIVYIKFGYIPTVILQSFNSRTGIPTRHRVKKTLQELKQLVSQINSMVARVQAGDFEQR